jgi:hypothetical protein
MRAIFDNATRRRENTIHQELRQGFDEWVKGLRQISLSPKDSLLGDLKTVARTKNTCNTAKSRQ